MPPFIAHRYTAASHRPAAYRVAGFSFDFESARVWSLLCTWPVVFLYATNLYILETALTGAPDRAMLAELVD